MDKQWDDLMREVEARARSLTPDANRHVCGILINLLEKALLDWAEARGQEFIESDLYMTHYEMLKRFRARVTVMETNRELADLRIEMTEWRETFMTDSVNEGIDYTEAYRNLRALVPDTVPLSLRHQLPTPPHLDTRRQGQYGPGPSSRPFAPGPNRAAVSNHNPALPIGQARRRADSEIARPQQLSFPTQQQGQFHGAGAETPVPRSRQASDSSRSGGFGSLFRRKRTTSAVHSPPPPNFPHSGPPPPPPQMLPHAGTARARPGASRLSLNEVLRVPAQQQQQQQSFGFLATDPHPYPATQHAARMPPPGPHPAARSTSSLPSRLPGRQAGHGRPPAPAVSSPRESPIGFRTEHDSYDAALAYEMQMNEYRMAARGPPPPPLEPPETEEQRRRRRKGKGREEPPPYYGSGYGPGGGGPPYGGPPPTGGSAGGASAWR